MTDKNKILRKLISYDLYDEKTNTIYDYSKNIEKKATLRNLRNLYIRILEDEAINREKKGTRIRKKEDRETRLKRAIENKIRRQKKRLREIEKKNQRYSITITFIDELKNVRTNFVANRNEKDLKLVENKPFTKKDAEEKLNEIEDIANQKDSEYKHNYSLESVKNIQLDRKNRLQDSKMFKMDYSFYNRMVSDWKDNGKMECVYDYLLHRYNGIHNLRLTKERIYDIIYNFDYKTNNRNFKSGLSSVELNKFCRWLGIPMYAIDRDCNLFYKFLPTNRDKNYPVLAFICSNNHLYPIENKTYIYGYRNIAYNNVIKSNSVVNYEQKKEKKLKKVIIDNKNLNDMLDKLIYKDKLMPKINRYNGDVHKIITSDIIYSACPDIEEIKEYCKILDLEFTGQTIIELGINLFKKLYKNHKQTVLNCNLLKLFRENNKSAFTHTFREPLDNEDNVITRDINKCYTSILRDNEYPYPVFNVCDSIEKYDGKPIGLGFYWVETDNFFPLKKSGLYCYSTLLECEKLGIQFKPIYQIRASSQLPANYFKKFVNNALKIEKFKTLVNTTIGFFNKIKTTFKQSRFTTDKNEANYFFWNKFKKVEENGNKIHYVDRFNENIFEIETVNFNTKYENDIPIYQQILETGWIRIYKLYKFLGGDLLAVKTDSITVSNPVNDCKISEDIGGFKIEPNPSMYKKWKTIEGKFNADMKDFDEVDENQYLEDREEYITNDNFDYVNSIVEDILISNEGVFIDGRAGTGKSVIIRKLNKILDDKNLKYINLAPTNKASRNINGITLHKFFNIGFDNKSINIKKLIKIKRLDYVFVDEISMVSSNLLRFLHLAKMNNPNIKFVCVGDSWQLSPVRENKHTKSYCLKYLCDFNKLNLTVNKRFDKKLRDIAERWYLTGKIDLGRFSCKYDSVERFLTYTNRRRREINYRMMLKRKKKKKFLELKLNMSYEDDKENPVSQDLILNIGMPIISRKNCLKFGICNNDEYRVVNFDKRNRIIIINNDEKSEYTYNEFQEYFLPAYAITIHKSQGQTYDKPYMICEIEKIKKCEESRSLLYVALTRARCRSIIRIEKPNKINTDKIRYNNQFIKKKIEGYNQQDLKKNLKNDLTVEAIQDLINKNMNVCYYCRRNLHQQSFTLDRIDSGASHNISNVVLCCVSCNRVKSNRDISVMY